MPVPAPTPAAFYCVTDHHYFLGAVAMLNSLRLLGHTEPLYVCDCGLTEAQRELIEPHATLVTAPGDAPPWLMKTIAPLTHPAEAMVLIDVDMVATRRLDDLIRIAGDGRIVVVAHGSERFVPEWGELLDLGPVRRQPYVSSGLIALSGVLGERILRLMADRQDRVDFEQTYWRRNVPGYPFLYADQCVLNAILASQEVEPDRIEMLDRRLEAIPPFKGLEIIDEATLRCAYADGLEPYTVHHYTAKPWLQSTHDGVYSRLLRRLLWGPGIAIRVPERAMPLRLRSGRLARANQTLINGREQLRWRVADPLVARLRRLRPGGGTAAGT